MDKYKEALEKARELHGTVAAGRDFLAEIFPELREIEDERVREEIKEFIFKQADRGDLIAKRKKWISYLERQKEQKPALTPERIHPKFAVGDTVCRPMWSDHTVREIYVRCNDPVYICVNEEGTESHIPFSEQDEWERKEQKPAEWSEEDEKVWQDIFDLCNRFGYDDACRKLKSIRPKPHWKPSEEQMGTLKQWLQDHELDGDSRDVYPIFYSLFADLQKLL